MFFRKIKIKLLLTYNERSIIMFMKKLMLFTCLSLFSATAILAQDFEYIGAAKCKMCHNKSKTGAQYKKWAAGKHAKAMDVLKGAEKKDPKCIKCHSTYGSVDKDLIATLTLEEGVSCESCHGPGSAYKPNSIMKSRKKSLAKGLILPTEELCIKCHNSESPNFKGFNYKEYLKKIAHPVPVID